MKATKRIIALLMALAMLVALGACGGEGNSSSEAPVSKPSEESSKVESTSGGEIDLSEHVNLTFLVPGDPSEGDFGKQVAEKWNEVFNEKINASVELNFLGWNDWETRYALMLMSGENLDLVTCGAWMQIWDNASKGAFMNIGDLLPTYAPYLWESRDAAAWDSAKYKGEIFFVPQTDYSQWTDQGFEYRVDWANQFGMTDGLNSFEDIDEYLGHVKEAFPDIIPFDAHKDRKELWWDWVQAKTDHVMMEMVTTGFTNLFYINSAEDYTVICPVFEDEVIMGFGDMMKSWSDKGYYREDVMNSSVDEHKVFQEGMTALCGRHSQNFLRGDRYSFRKGMAEKGNTEADIAFVPIANMNNNLCTLDPANDGVAIARGCKNPERALMALDLIYSDPELYRLMQYGIEGINYSIDEEGKRLRQDVEQYPVPEYEFFSNLWGCRNDACEIPSISEEDNAVEEFAARAAIAKPFPFSGFAFDGTPVQTQLAAVSNACSQYMPLLTYGKVESVENTVKEFRTALEVAGYEDILKEIQSQIDAYLAAK